MARNYVNLEQIVNDFIITIDGDDFVANATDTIVRTFALRGIREMGFDISQKIRSLKMNVNATNNTVELPDDYVDLIKIGVIGADGLVYVFGENRNMHIAQKYKVTSGSDLVAANAIDSDSDGVFDRVDVTESGEEYNALRGYDSYVFRNYLYENSNGQLYGLGGGQYNGEYRINLDQSRIELSINDGVSAVVMEYVCDEARSKNPTVHVFMEEALRAYIYYKLVQNKASVPMGEKMRARTEYYNERRLANSRMKTFTKEEALKTIRKNTKQAPKL
jgi:hypothetical protein|tara:strand:- start:5215 stop:6042 length:828 start_codon:yes stop_codon:yes gene_type:complete